MQVPVQQTSGERSAPDVESITQALSAPFDRSEVKFKPAVVSGNRALALAYVDARAIQDRLDEVLGVLGWQDSYRVLPDGSVMCRLRLKIGGEWITKVDVGGQSEQPDGGDRLKAAVSDALKRAAVKFGIGRYLYRLPQQWCDYDPHKRQFVKPPTLPTSVLPPTKKEPAQPVMRKEEPKPAKAAPAKPQPAAVQAPKLAAHGLPANGADLQRRLYEYDARLAAQSICRQGDLVKHVVQAGVKAGYDSDLAAWSGPAIQFAVEQTKAFETARRQSQAPRKDVA